MKEARFSFVSARAGSNVSQSSCISHQVTARSVTLRNTLPLDQHTTSFPSSFVSFSWSVATVVPCPSRSRRKRQQATRSFQGNETPRMYVLLSSFSMKPEKGLTLPVPDSPQSTTTPPPAPPSLPLTMPNISSATSSGLFPRTSMLMYSSGTKSGSSTPLSLAMSIPLCSFDASSSSRRRMPSPSDSDNDAKSDEDA